MERHSLGETSHDSVRKDICGDLDAALRREWLETNGLGWFASSTIMGLNTRRYHGLLVATLKPPVERFVLLSKLGETLFIDGQPFDLSANRYPGTVHPQGFRYLKQFRLDPFPTFIYEVEGVEIEKTVFMVHGENSTVVQYELKKNNHPERPKNLNLEAADRIPRLPQHHSRERRHQPCSGRAAWIGDPDSLPGAALSPPSAQCCGTAKNGRLVPEL